MVCFSSYMIIIGGKISVEDLPLDGIIFLCFLEPFPTLKAIFHIDRLFPHYLYHVYIPGMLLVALSWCTFWIPPSAVPARVTLIVTNFLSSLFIFESAAASIPKVPYQTAMEMFNLTNTSCIIFGMVEYIMVLSFPGFARSKVNIQI